jgi:hypothetical protein
MSVGTLDGGVRAADGARDGHSEENHAAPNGTRVGSSVILVVGAAVVRGAVGALVGVGHSGASVGRTGASVGQGEGAIRRFSFDWISVSDS